MTVATMSRAGRVGTARTTGTTSSRHLRVVPEPVMSAAPRLRLTGRGRFVLRLLLWSAVAVVAAAALLIGTLVAGGSADAGADLGVPVAVTEHVVLQGETLWSIAGEVAPQSDPRETIARIVELNALPGVEIRAGQKLYLPAS